MLVSAPAGGLKEGGRAVVAPPPMAQALSRGLTQLGLAVEPQSDAFQHLAVPGIAHDHFVVAGAPDIILRLPRFSQLGFDPESALAYEAACFVQAAPSARTPTLLGVIPVDPDLPRGCLVVTRVFGSPPRVPTDLPACAQTLAAIHAQPLLPAACRTPLPDHADPAEALLNHVLAQAAAIKDAGLIADAAAILEAEIFMAKRWAARRPRRAAPRCLTVGDAHPGNFLIDAHGQAIFVDLERAAYGAPAVDLAHLTLPTSLGWMGHPPLSAADIAAVYHSWCAAVAAHDAPAIAEGTWCDLLGYRRLTWLRTATWFCRWIVELVGTHGQRGGPDPARLRCLLAPDKLAAARMEWQADGPVALALFG